jgi:hypothetical protein
MEENIADKSVLESYAVFQLVARVLECTMPINISFVETEFEVRESTAV